MVGGQFQMCAVAKIVIAELSMESGRRRATGVYRHRQHSFSSRSCAVSAKAANRVRPDDTPSTLLPISLSDT